MFNSSRSSFICELIDTKKIVRARIIKNLKSPVATAQTICASAIPKGKRLEFMIQKLTELGLSRFIPLNCERSVAHLSTSKLNRLTKIAQEACKQSGRSTVLEIMDEQPFKKVIEENADLRLIAAPDSSTILLDALNNQAGSILYLIGPEGGFTKEEQNLAVKAGFKAVCVASYILRIKTCAIAVQSIISQFFLGSCIKREKIL